MLNAEITNPFEWQDDYTERMDAMQQQIYIMNRQLKLMMEMLTIVTRDYHERIIQTNTTNTETTGQTQTKRVQATS
jgi:hypothetical protein